MSGSDLFINHHSVLGLIFSDSVLIRKFKGMLADTEESWQKSCIWDDIPAQCEGDVLVSPKTVAVIPEIIFCVHVLEVQHGILTAKNNFVPKHDLKDEIEGQLK